jgi:hypothetical protein
VTIHVCFSETWKAHLGPAFRARTRHYAERLYVEYLDCPHDVLVLFVDQFTDKGDEDGDTQAVTYVERHRSFPTIEIKYTDAALSFDEMRGLLVHEFIHVRQWLDKRLWVEGDHFYWFQKEFDDNSVKYDELPWEVEVCQLKDSILERFQ